MCYTFYLSFTISSTAIPHVYTTLFVLLCFFGSQSPLGQGLLMHDVYSSQTTMHHSQQDSSGRVISSPQRLLPDNIQHSQQTNIHAPGGFRTYNLSRRAAIDLRPRPRSHWDRLTISQETHKETYNEEWKFVGFLQSPYVVKKSVVFMVENFIQNRKLKLLERTADPLKPGGQLGHPLCAGVLQRA
jgi:hypothetical protein